MTAAQINALVDALLSDLPALTQEDHDDLAQRQIAGERLASLIEAAPVARIAALAEAYPADAFVRRLLVRRLAWLRQPSAAAVADAIAEQERDAELAALA